MAEESHQTTQFQLGIVSGQQSSMIAQISALQTTFATHTQEDANKFELVNKRLNLYAGGLAVLVFVASIVGPVIAGKLIH